ncbi:MAG: SDR family oxidoreductase [Lachnospiraceae bacterium]|nr:SDR family oxidoreductase [Lachnospiraceae bacterium]
MNRLADKTAVFIGGGSSVGSVALQAFLEEGANVILVDIDEKYFERTAELRSRYGTDRVRTCIGACTSQEDMDAAMRFAADTFGRIDILVNIAGFHGSGHVHNIEETQWNLALNVTCTGAYRAIRSAILYMKEQNGGHIVNFTSLGGRGNRGVAISYAASKAACIGLSKAFAMELAPYNIRVTSFAPGTLDTKQFTRIAEKGSVPFKLPPGGIPGMPGYSGPLLYNGQSVIKDRPVADLEEIAYALVYLSGDESDYLTADCVDMNGGILMQT